jgi:hypothetical protein
MAVEYNRPVSHVARWARRFGFVGLILSIAAWGAMRFGPLTQPYFLELYLIACGLAALAVLGALIGLNSLWRVGAKGGKASIMAIVLSLPVLAPGAYAAWILKKLPPIYEVSTDLVDPPRWIETPDYDQMWLGTRPPAGEDMREAQYLTYPALIGHRYDGALDRVLEGAHKAAQDLHITIRLEDLPREEDPASQELQPGQIPVPTLRPGVIDPNLPPPPPAAARLQGDTAGFVTGFHYDVVIRLKEEGDTTLADIRVQARYGRADTGGSARIAGAYMKALDDALQGAGTAK